MMKSMESRANEIKNINKELEQLNKRKRLLIDRKKVVQQELYKYMSEHNLKNINDVKSYKIKPQESVPRKGLRSKKRDALNLFREVGIPNPEEFWNDFQKTQKITI